LGAVDAPDAAFAPSGGCDPSNGCDTAPVTTADGASGPAAPTAHVIVYGIRGVGLRTVEHLWAAGIETVAVASGPDDADPVAEALLDSWDVPRVSGRTREALDAAGLDRASAVICVPDDDLQAMQTALLIRRHRPHVRLVVRMGNSAVGRALAEVTGADSVLDVAALAAPTVVQACQGQRPRPIELAGETFYATELAAPADATLRELYGELAPLAVSGPAGGTVVCPGRDTPVHAGDRVTAVGTRRQFADRGVPVGADEPAPRHASGARSAGAVRAARLEEQGGAPGLRALLHTLVAEADRRLRMTLLTCSSSSAPRWWCCAWATSRSPASRCRYWTPCTSPSRPSARSGTATSPSPSRRRGCGPSRSG